jgi:hypothetical protein
MTNRTVAGAHCHLQTISRMSMLPVWQGHKSYWPTTKRPLPSYLAPILEHAGFAVHVAADGETALRLILEKQP